MSRRLVWTDLGRFRRRVSGRGHSRRAHRYLHKDALLLVSRLRFVPCLCRVCAVLCRVCAVLCLFSARTSPRKTAKVDESLELSI